MNNDPLRVGLVQISSQKDVEKNLKEADFWIRKAKEAGAHLIATPEMTPFIDNHPEEIFSIFSDYQGDLGVAFFSALARELKIWLLIGSIPVLSPLGTRKLRNRSHLFDPKGNISHFYDKIHLFDVDLPDGQTIRESDLYEPGDQLVTAALPWGTLGLTICYDLRFPTLYQTLAQGGANILAIPAAFTHTTGQAHWEVLLRARAIETGSFVIAPAQVGMHDCGRKTFGHSMIIGPWGEILGELDGENPGILLRDIACEKTQECRTAIPALFSGRIEKGSVKMT